MSKQIEALKLALEVLEYIYEGANNQGPHTGISWRCVSNKAEPAITAVKEALAEQPAQKPPKWQGARFDSALHQQPAQQPPTVAELLCVCGAEWEWRNRDWELVATPQPAQQQEPVAWIYKPNMELLWPDEIEVKDPSKHRGYKPLYTSPQPAQQEPVLQDIEQYRLQMAGISTAAIGYWKEGDGIHPDYDTVALRDVAKLYAKYDELYRAQQQEPVAVVSGYYGGQCVVLPTNPARIFNSGTAFYTSPQSSKPWVGLTDEDKLAIRRLTWETPEDLIDNTEAKLREKNA